MEYQDYIDKKICPVCNGNAEVAINERTHNLQVDCNVCGTYEITRELIDDNFVCADGVYDLNQLSSYLYYHKSSKSNLVLGESQNTLQKTHASPQTVENWYPKSFAEKIDLILLKLQETSKYEGAPIYVEDAVLFISKPGNSSEVDLKRRYYLDFLKTQGYLESFKGTYSYILTPKSAERVYELQKNQAHNKRVFVAMKFGEQTKELREKIKKGLSGYDVRIMDEIEHNHQIVPEMLKEIKDSRFVVAELSHHNNGAYYEAGYALGLGKEVIHICAKSELSSGLHFDVAQVNTIVYDTIDDIPRLLRKRVEATIL